MRRTWLLLTTCAACSFDGAPGAPDGPPPGEAEIALDSKADFEMGAELTDAFLTGFDTVEPIASLPGKLLVDIDDGAGPFGSWAMRPRRADLVNVGLMAPPFAAGQTPPGATGSNYILWLSGEIRLEKGAQKLALSTANNSTAFAEILGPGGALLATCTEAAECAVSAPTAGWYSLRMGWKRPSNAVNNTFELQYAMGVGIPTNISPDRLRVRTSAAELAGWRLEGYEAQRSTNAVTNAAALNHVEPFAMAWAPGLLGLTGSPGYRNAGQLRILEAGSYDFKITAASEAAYRLWIDGEWVTDPTRWNPQDGTEKQETKARDLTVGWHDVVLEGYENGGSSNSLRLAVGKTGTAAAAPPAAQVRPVLSATTAFTTGANLTTVQLIKATPVPQLLAVAPVATTSPPASAVDVWLRLQPKVWAGLVVTLRPPGVASPGIPLTVDLTGLSDDVAGDIHASLTQAQLGNAPAAGDWIVEVTHADDGGNLNTANALTRARLNVHYKGSAAIGNPVKILPAESRYVRMISLPEEHELRGLITSATVPAGATLTAMAQICKDATGTSCEAPLSHEQLQSDSPVAQHIKLVVTFGSDGFSTPILEKLALRYRK